MENPIATGSVGARSQTEKMTFPSGQNPTKESDVFRETREPVRLYAGTKCKILSTRNIIHRRFMEKVAF
jgi:hypothetical protein